MMDKQQDLQDIPCKKSIQKFEKSRIIMEKFHSLHLHFRKNHHMNVDFLNVVLYYKLAII